MVIKLDLGRKRRAGGIKKLHKQESEMKPTALAKEAYEKSTKALALARKNKVQIEQKYFTQATYTTALSTTFLVNDLYQLVQGDTATTRDGNQAYIKHVEIRAFFESNAGSNTTSCMGRFVIVQDLQQVANTDITNGIVFNNAASWNSNYNFPTAQGRFKVLVDKTFDLTPVSLGYQNPGLGASASSFNKNVHFKLMVHPVRPKCEYNGANANNMQKNGLYMLLAKSNGGYTVTPDIQIQIKFSDL